jgi:predicted patatin/cPLA2 family phospholipase
VDREGRTLVDGGVIAYVPVRAALQAGAASVVVLSRSYLDRTADTVIALIRAHRGAPAATDA